MTPAEIKIEGTRYIRFDTFLFAVTGAVMSGLYIGAMAVLIATKGAGV